MCMLSLSHSQKHTILLSLIGVEGKKVVEQSTKSERNHQGYWEIPYLFVW